MIDEGYIKFDVDWTVSPPLTHREIDALIRWRSVLFEAGLIGHYASLGIGFGNLSARVDDSRQFVISATQTGHIAATGPEHYALVTDYDVDRNWVACRGPLKASSESLTHAAIYALDASIKAVVHVHDDTLWSRSLQVIPTTRPDVAYGTPEMAREFGRLFAETDFGIVGVAAMAGHEAGLVAVGGSIAEAASRILALCRPSRSRDGADTLRADVGLEGK